MYHADNVIFVN